MSATVDILNPAKPKRVLLIASNPTVSQQTGWPIGFWASELVHPYYEFVENGYEVDIASPDGGKLEIDGYSNPEDKSHYSEEDILSLGFLKSRKHKALLEKTPALKDVNPDNYDAILVIGGQGPMYTFYENEALHRFVADFYEKGKPVGVICHGTCILLKVKLSNGKLLVDGLTWTGFANSEEDYADNAAGTKIQPFRIEEEARKLPNTNFIVHKRFARFAVRDGNLITGQQQYSGKAAAQQIIAALGE